MLLRRNETAAVEITALAAGAGPPANKIATRRMFDSMLRRGSWTKSVLRHGYRLRSWQFVCRIPAPSQRNSARSAR